MELYSFVSARVAVLCFFALTRFAFGATHLYNFFLASLSFSLKCHSTIDFLHLKACAEKLFFPLINDTKRQRLLQVATNDQRQTCRHAAQNRMKLIM